VTSSAQLREYAESPDRFSEIPAGASVERFADERICILQGPTWASVSGVSVDADAVPALLAEVRERVLAEKEPVWWIGPSARPRSLHEQLHGLGLIKPRDRVPILRAVVLTHEPEAPSEDVEVSRIETYAQFRDAREVQWEAFETPVDRRERERARLRQDFEESRRSGVPLRFLALLDGRPAATALAVPSDRGVFLIGGATAGWARGRGVYRALVRARWDYAVARGTPALVTQAAPDTSYPILRRLGFEDVCVIRRLEDAHAPERRGDGLSR
jgi:hypothetical protein